MEPITAKWNLDALKTRKPLFVPSIGFGGAPVFLPSGANIPHWMRMLSAEELLTFLRLIDSGEEGALEKFLMRVSPYLQQGLRARKKILEGAGDVAVRRRYAAMASICLKESKSKERVYDGSDRGLQYRFARVVRGSILYPALKKILAHNGRKRGIAPDEESRLMIGTWHRELPLFRGGENRLLLPMGQEEAEVPTAYRNRMKQERADIHTFLSRNPLPGGYDAVFLLDPHAFLASGEETAYAFEWARHRLKPGGVAVAAFPEVPHASSLGSYSHYMLEMGQELPVPRQYEKVLAQCGIPYSTRRSELAVRGQTEAGRSVLRDLLRTFLPLERQDREGDIRAYESRLQRECGGVLRYSVYFLVSSINDAQSPFIIPAPSTIITHTPIARSRPRTEEMARPTEEPAYTDVYAKLPSMTPGQILELLSSIAEKTNGGEERLLIQHLKKIGLPLVRYRELISSEWRLEQLANLIEEFDRTGKVPDARPMPREAADHFVMAIIVGLFEHPGDLQERLEECGLSFAIFDQWRKRLLGEGKAERIPRSRPRRRFRPEPVPWDASPKPSATEAPKTARREREERERRTLPSTQKRKPPSKEATELPLVTDTAVSGPHVVPVVSPVEDRQPIVTSLLWNRLAIIRELGSSSSAKNPAGSAELTELLEERLSLVRRITSVSGHGDEETVHPL